jgi:tetratricopeptide (TPR) repeat protein
MFWIAALAGAVGLSASAADDPLKVKREANELFMEGEAEYDKEDFPAAIKKFEEALAKDPTMADAQFNVGVCYGELGETEKALDSYHKTLKIDSQYKDAYFNIGRIYHLKKDFVQATAYYEKALGRDPYDPEFLFNYAHVLMEGGKVDEAIDAWKRYLIIAESKPEEAKWVERAKEYLATLEGVKGGAGTAEKKE